MAFAKRLGLAAVKILPGLVLMLYFCQNWLIFHGWKLDKAPDLPKIPGRVVEHVSFPSSDGVTCRGVYMGATASVTQPLVLMSHGNGGHLEWCFGRMGTLGTLPVDFFVYDYRGFGQSDGSPSVPGVMDDAAAAVRYLQTHRGLGSGPVILYGYSLGTGVSSTILDRKLCRVTGIVYEAPFLSVRAMAARNFPGIGPLVLSYDLPSETILASYTGPLAIFHAPDDGVIPQAQGRKLFDLCPSTSKEFIAMPAGVGGHAADFHEDPHYMPVFQRMIASATGSGEPQR